MRGLLGGVVVLFATCLHVFASATCLDANGNHASLYAKPNLFIDAVAGEQDFPPAKVRLTGITVPHHLVAAHLVARGFRAASNHAYKRVIVLTPDHFSRSRTPFATTTDGFATPLGIVDIDQDAVAHLLAEDLISHSCLFAREHGLHALLPFMRHYLPGAKLVPVAISLKANRTDWDHLVEILAPLADADTLIVQSTDFSHYHPHEKARVFDQQVLNVIASGSFDELLKLHQPDHLDSLGSLYVQMKLQRELHGAHPMVITSENQQQYTHRRVQETTSYIAMLFARSEDRVFAHEDNAEVVYFGGDTHFGRAMTQALADADAADRVAEAVLSRTQGRPLVLNLEGVILPNVPGGLPHLTLAMPEELTIDWLERLNVVGVSLANNHALDLGTSGLAETLQALERAGIPSMGQGERLDIGRLSIVGFTDLDSNGPPYTALATPELLDNLIVSDATRPVAAFVHWGQEYVGSPSPREAHIADELRLRGVPLIIGAHPHVADGELRALGGGETLMAYSLGNFLFDQSARRASGSLLELRLFDQGTFFARLLPLPNPFDLATRH